MNLFSQVQIHQKHPNNKQCLLVGQESFAFKVSASARSCKAFACNSTCSHSSWKHLLLKATNHQSDQSVSEHLELTNPLDEDLCQANGLMNMLSQESTGTSAPCLLKRLEFFDQSSSFALSGKGFHTYLGSGWIWQVVDLDLGWSWIFSKSCRPFSTKVWTSPSHNPSHVIPPVAGAASKRSVCCSRLLRRSLARMACGLWEAGHGIILFLGANHCESFKVIQDHSSPWMAWAGLECKICQSLPIILSWDYDDYDTMRWILIVW